MSADPGHPEPPQRSGTTQQVRPPTEEHAGSFMAGPDSKSGPAPGAANVSSASKKRSTAQSQAPREFKQVIITIDDDYFNPDKPRRKRQRTRVACSTCSARKIKCTGRRPVCEACERTKSQCIYRAEDDKSRGAASDTEAPVSASKARRKSDSSRDSANRGLNRAQADNSHEGTMANSRHETARDFDPVLKTSGIESDSSYHHAEKQKSRSTVNLEGSKPLTRATPTSNLVSQTPFPASATSPPQSMQTFSPSSWPVMQYSPGSSGASSGPNRATSIYLSPSQYPMATPMNSNHIDNPGVGTSTKNLIDGQSRVRIPYFRWFGPTGIVPGFTKVLVDLRRSSGERGVLAASATSSPEQTMSTFPSTHISHMDAHTADTHSDQLHSPITPSQISMIFSPDDEMVPNSEVLEHLLQIFFTYFGCHFPLYHRDRFLELTRSKSVSTVLLNSMCALASRFSRHPHVCKEPVYLSGEVFADKAKQLIISLLAVPSYDLVASLLILSWYEFGCNRDVGMWMYTGMAIRMAQDLGMHKSNEEREDRNTPNDSSEDRRESEEETAMRLNLFWSIYFIDRIISLGTGRPLTIRDEQVSCPLPSDGTSLSDRATRPNPFPHMIRIMMVQGRVNEEISKIRKPEDLTPAKRAILLTFQDEIIQIYTSLDSRLTFNVSNFQSYVSSEMGGSFLLLHIWFHAVIITLHRPGLMFGRDTLAHTLGKESLEVSMSSAKTITAILGLAELIDDKTIVGNPFLNQAIYIAGIAFIAESEMYATTSRNGEGSQRNVIGRVSDQHAATSESLISGSDSFTTGFNSQLLPGLSSSESISSQSLLKFASKRNYETCQNSISLLKRYWRGIGWILSTMEQKAKGSVRTDPSEESVDPASEIDFRDTGMLQRLLVVKNELARKRRENDKTRNNDEGVHLTDTQASHEVTIGMGFAGKGESQGQSEETLAVLYPDTMAPITASNSQLEDKQESGYSVGPELWIDLNWLDSMTPQGF